VSVKEIDPVWVPTEPIRPKVTCTVHVPPGARLVPVQLSVPLVKDQIKPAPETLTDVTATLELPAADVFVNVTFADPVKVPEGSVIVSGLGVIDTLDLASTPVPVRLTGLGVTVAPV